MKFDHDDRSPIKMITALKERRVSSRKSIRRLFIQRIIDPSNGNPNLQRNFNTRRKDKFVIFNSIHPNMWFIKCYNDAQAGILDSLATNSVLSLVPVSTIGKERWSWQITGPHHMLCKTNIGNDTLFKNEENQTLRLFMFHLWNPLPYLDCKFD